MRFLKMISSIGAVAAVLAPAPPAMAQNGALTENDAVRIALEQNYTYRQSAAGVDQARGSRLESIAGLLPQFSGSATYSKSDQTSSSVITSIDGMPVPQIDLPTNVNSSNTNLGLSVNENLSLPSWYRYRSAHQQVQAAEHGRRASAHQLVFDVRQQFYLVLRAQDLLQVQEEDLRLARDEERRINSMFELGSVARVDVLKARVRVSDAEVALIRQQNTVEIERARLATLLGLSPDTRLTIEGDLSTAQAGPIDSVQAVEDAEFRPDLQQARADFGSASNLYKAGVTSRLPSVFASFRLGTDEGESAVDRFEFDESQGGFVPVSYESDNSSDSWSIQVGAQVNLDAFLNMGEHKRTRAGKRRAELNLQGLELEVKREIEEAILNYRASAKAIDAAQRGVESAHEDLRLSEERYQQGLGTVLELLESQVALTRARNSLVNALTGLKISEAALDKARGAPIPY